MLPKYVIKHNFDHLILSKICNKYIKRVFNEMHNPANDLISYLFVY